MEKEINNNLQKIISIIIPCYNSETTIIDTLDSLKNNNPSLFEVIIVNDGSSDSTELIVKKYINKSCLDIKFINLENQGVSVARNYGIEIALGKYIIFLDSDDLLAENYINAIKELTEKDYDVISCSRTSNIKKLTPIINVNGKTTNVSPLYLLEKYTYSKKELGLTSFAYKREIIFNCNLRFTKGSRYGEDFEFATKYLANCNTAIMVNCYYYYRIINTSASRSIKYSQVDAIYSAERATLYLQKLSHPFYKYFNDYMVSRAIFSCAHRFAKGKNRTLFNKLIDDFDVSSAMKQLAKNKKADLKTKIAALIFCCNKSLFYLLAGIF